MPDIVQFVDSIASTPTVRLDLNDGVTWGLNYEGTDLSPPELKEAWSGTLMADGELLTASAFRNRTLVFALDLMTSTVDNQGVELQKLWRELNRPPVEPGGPNNVIRWQPNGQSKPVFFRTFRSSRNRVRDLPGAGTFRILTVEIEAEPTADGLKETVGANLLSNGTFEAGISPWTAQNGAVVQSATFAHSGTQSCRLTPTGGLSPVAARSEMVPVTVGLPYVASCWVYSVGGWVSGVSAAIDWFNSSNSLISTTTGTITAVPAATWTQYQTVATPPVGAVTAQLRARMAGTPAATDVLYVDDASVSQYLTVSNDPATAINGQYFDITPVMGDVETPLRLSLPIAAASSDGRQSAIAVRRRGTPSAAPFVLQAEAMTTLGADTTVQANSAVMSGSGSNWTRTTFATTTAMGARLTALTWPAAGSQDVRGRYRVLARIRKTVAADPISLQLAWGGGIALRFGDVVPTASSGTIHLVDLGVISFPVGPDPVTDGYSGTVLPARGQRVDLRASRTSGSGNLDVDYLLFLPADDRLTLVKWGGWAGGVGTAVVDGTSESVYGLTSIGEVGDGVPAEVIGRWPLVSPGSQVNRICFVRTVGPATSGVGPPEDTLTDTTALTVEYWPRYLSVRPPTS